MTTNSRSIDSSHDEEEQAVGGPKFSPLLYIQRYMLVQKILRENGIQSVVDFGSAELKVFRWLKDIDSLQHIFLVDIDEVVLKSNINSIKPLTLEFIFPRSSPLTVTVLAGSAADLDQRVAGVQAATLIEIIEHLEPEMLQKVTNSVFGQLRPNLVVVTTPNADFNILFPNFTGFRHWDHKFEWTQDQFQVWCSDVCEKYGYKVQFTGSGDPPPEMSHVGPCSQVAVFTEAIGKAGEATDIKAYGLVHEVAYPVDLRSAAERLAGEVSYMINCCCLEDRYLNEDQSLATIPLADLVDNVMSRQISLKWTKEDLLNYLHEKHELTAAGDSIVVHLHDDTSSQSSTCSDNVEVDNLPEEIFSIQEEEKWD